MSWTDEDEVVRFEDCKTVHTTSKALLVSISELGDEFWVPLSVIHDDSEVFEAGDEGDLVLEEWWARKEGLL